MVSGRPHTARAQECGHAGPVGNRGDAETVRYRGYADTARKHRCARRVAQRTARSRTPLVPPSLLHGVLSTLRRTRGSQQSHTREAAMARTGSYNSGRAGRLRRVVGSCCCGRAGSCCSPRSVTPKGERPPCSPFPLSSPRETRLEPSVPGAGPHSIFRARESRRPRRATRQGASHWTTSWTLPH